MKFACLTDTPAHTWFTPSMLAENGVVGFALAATRLAARCCRTAT